VGVGWTSIGAPSEVWVGDRRDADSVSDWGEYLRTTGSGLRATLDLTHVRLSRLYNLVDWTIETLNDNKSHKKTLKTAPIKINHKVCVY
jgi:hypothetical protein